MTDASESIDLEDLRALAEAATLGKRQIEWDTDEYNAGVPEVYATRIWIGGAWVDSVSDLDYEDAEFIAATDPQTVLALIERAESAERRIEGVKAEALRDAADGFRLYGDRGDQAVVMATVENYLNDRADRIEKGESNDQ